MLTALVLWLGMVLVVVESSRPVIRECGEKTIESDEFCYERPVGFAANINQCNQKLGFYPMLMGVSYTKSQTYADCVGLVEQIYNSHAYRMKHGKNPLGVINRTVDSKHGANRMSDAEQFYFKDLFSGCFYDSITSQTHYVTSVTDPIGINNYPMTKDSWNKLSVVCQRKKNPNPWERCEGQVRTADQNMLNYPWIAESLYPWKKDIGANVYYHGCNNECINFLSNMSVSQARNEWHVFCQDAVSADPGGFMAEVDGNNFHCLVTTDGNSPTTKVSTFELGWQKFDATHHGGLFPNSWCYPKLQEPWRLCGSPYNSFRPVFMEQHKFSLHGVWSDYCECSALELLYTQDYERTADTECVAVTGGTHAQPWDWSVVWRCESNYDFTVPCNEDTCKRTCSTEPLCMGFTKKEMTPFADSQWTVYRESYNSHCMLHFASAASALAFRQKNKAMMSQTPAYGPETLLNEIGERRDLFTKRNSQFSYFCPILSPGNFDNPWVSNPQTYVNKEAQCFVRKRAGVDRIKPQFWDTNDQGQKICDGLTAPTTHAGSTTVRVNDCTLKSSLEIGKMWPYQKRLKEVDGDTADSMIANVVGYCDHNPDCMGFDLQYPTRQANNRGTIYYKSKQVFSEDRILNGTVEAALREMIYDHGTTAAHTGYVSEQATAAKDIKMVRCFSMVGASDAAGVRQDDTRGLAHSFHKECDKKGPTVTIVETEQGFVFGGVSGVYSWSTPNVDTIATRQPLPSSNVHEYYTEEDMAALDRKDGGMYVDVPELSTQTSGSFLFCVTCYGNPTAGIHKLKKLIPQELTYFGKYGLSSFPPQPSLFLSQQWGPVFGGHVSHYMQKPLEFPYLGHDLAVDGYQIGTDLRSTSNLGLSYECPANPTRHLDSLDPVTKIWGPFHPSPVCEAYLAGNKTFAVKNYEVYAISVDNHEITKTSDVHAALANVTLDTTTNHVPSEGVGPPCGKLMYSNAPGSKSTCVQITDRLCKEHVYGASSRWQPNTCFVDDQNNNFIFYDPGLLFTGTAQNPVAVWAQPHSSSDIKQTWKTVVCDIFPNCLSNFGFYVDDLITTTNNTLEQMTVTDVLDGEEQTLHHVGPKVFHACRGSSDDDKECFWDGAPVLDMLNTVDCSHTCYTGTNRAANIKAVFLVVEREGARHPSSSHLAVLKTSDLTGKHMGPTHKFVCDGDLVMCGRAVYVEMTVLGSSLSAKFSDQHSTTQSLEMTLSKCVTATDPTAPTVNDTVTMSLNHGCHDDLAKLASETGVMCEYHDSVDRTTERPQCYSNLQGTHHVMYYPSHQEAHLVVRLAGVLGEYNVTTSCMSPEDFPGCLSGKTTPTNIDAYLNYEEQPYVCSGMGNFSMNFLELRRVELRRMLRNGEHEDIYLSPCMKNHTLPELDMCFRDHPDLFGSARDDEEWLFGGKSHTASDNVNFLFWGPKQTSGAKTSVITSAWRDRPTEVLFRRERAYTIETKGSTAADTKELLKRGFNLKSRGLNGEVNEIVAPHCVDKYYCIPGPCRVLDMNYFGDVSPDTRVGSSFATSEWDAADLPPRNYKRFMSNKTVVMTGKSQCSPVFGTQKVFHNGIVTTIEKITDEYDEKTQMFSNLAAKPQERDADTYRYLSQPGEVVDLWPGKVPFPSPWQTKNKQNSFNPLYMYEDTSGSTLGKIKKPYTCEQTNRKLKSGRLPMIYLVPIKPGPHCNADSCYMYKASLDWNKSAFTKAGAYWNSKEACNLGCERGRANKTAQCNALCTQENKMCSTALKGAKDCKDMGQEFYSYSYEPFYYWNPLYRPFVNKEVSFSPIHIGCTRPAEPTNGESYNVNEKHKQLIQKPRQLPLNIRISTFGSGVCYKTSSNQSRLPHGILSSRPLGHADSFGMITTYPQAAISEDESHPGIFSPHPQTIGVVFPPHRTGGDFTNLTDGAQLKMIKSLSPFIDWSEITNLPKWGPNQCHVFTRSQDGGGCSALPYMVPAMPKKCGMNKNKQARPDAFLGNNSWGPVEVDVIHRDHDNYVRPTTVPLTRFLTFQNEKRHCPLNDQWVERIMYSVDLLGADELIKNQMAAKAAASERYKGMTDVAHNSASDLYEVKGKRTMGFKSYQTGDIFRDLWSKRETDERFDIAKNDPIRPMDKEHEATFGKFLYDGEYAALLDYASFTSEFNLDDLKNNGDGLGMIRDEHYAKEEDEEKHSWTALSVMKVLREQGRQKLLDNPSRNFETEVFGKRLRNNDDGYHPQPPPTKNPMTYPTIQRWFDRIMIEQTKNVTDLSLLHTVWDYMRKCLIAVETSGDSAFVTGNTNKNWKDAVVSCLKCTSVNPIKLQRSDFTAFVPPILRANKWANSAHNNWLRDSAKCSATQTVDANGRCTNRVELEFPPDVKYVPAPSASLGVFGVTSWEAFEAKVTKTFPFLDSSTSEPTLDTTLMQEYDGPDCTIDKREKTADKGGCVNNPAYLSNILRQEADVTWYPPAAQQFLWNSRLDGFEFTDRGFEFADPHRGNNLLVNDMPVDQLREHHLPRGWHATLENRDEAIAGTFSGFVSKRSPLTRVGTRDEIGEPDYVTPQNKDPYSSTSFDPIKAMTRASTDYETAKGKVNEWHDACVAFDEKFSWMENESEMMEDCRVKNFRAKGPGFTDTNDEHPGCFETTEGAFWKYPYVFSLAKLNRRELDCTWLGYPGSGPPCERGRSKLPRFGKVLEEHDRKTFDFQGRIDPATSTQKEYQMPTNMDATPFCQGVVDLKQIVNSMDAVDTVFKRLLDSQFGLGFNANPHDWCPANELYPQGVPPNYFTSNHAERDALDGFGVLTDAFKMIDRHLKDCRRVPTKEQASTMSSLCSIWSSGEPIDANNVVTWCLASNDNNNDPVEVVERAGYCRSVFRRVMAQHRQEFLMYFEAFSLANFVPGGLREHTFKNNYKEDICVPDIRITPDLHTQEGPFKLPEQCTSPGRKSWDFAPQPDEAKVYAWNKTKDFLSLAVTIATTIEYPPNKEHCLRIMPFAMQMYMRGANFRPTFPLSPTQRENKQCSGYPIVDQDQRVVYCFDVQGTTLDVGVVENQNFQYGCSESCSNPKAFARLAWHVGEPDPLWYKAPNPNPISDFNDFGECRKNPGIQLDQKSDLVEWLSLSDEIQLKEYPISVSLEATGQHPNYQNKHFLSPFFAWDDLEMVRWINVKHPKSFDQDKDEVWKAIVNRHGFRNWWIPESKRPGYLYPITDNTCGPNNERVRTVAFPRHVLLGMPEVADDQKDDMIITYETSLKCDLCFFQGHKKEMWPALHSSGMYTAATVVNSVLCDLRDIDDLMNPDASYKSSPHDNDNTYKNPYFEHSNYDSLRPFAWKPGIKNWMARSHLGRRNVFEYSNDHRNLTRTFNERRDKTVGSIYNTYNNYVTKGLPRRYKRYGVSVSDDSSAPADAEQSTQKARRRRDWGPLEGLKDAVTCAFGSCDLADLNANQEIFRQHRILQCHPQSRTFRCKEGLDGYMRLLSNTANGNPGDPCNDAHTVFSMKPSIAHRTSCIYRLGQIESLEIDKEFTNKLKNPTGRETLGAGQASKCHLYMSLPLHRPWPYDNGETHDWNSYDKMVHGEHGIPKDDGKESTPYWEDAWRVKGYGSGKFNEPLLRLADKRDEHWGADFFESPYFHQYAQRIIDGDAKGDGDTAKGQASAPIVPELHHWGFGGLPRETPILSHLVHDTKLGSEFGFLEMIGNGELNCSNSYASWEPATVVVDAFQLDESLPVPSKNIDDNFFPTGEVTCLTEKQVGNRPDADPEVLLSENACKTWWETNVVNTVNCGDKSEQTYESGCIDLPRSYCKNSDWQQACPSTCGKCLELKPRPTPYVDAATCKSVWQQARKDQFQAENVMDPSKPGMVTTAMFRRPGLYEHLSYLEGGGAWWLGGTAVALCAERLKDSQPIGERRAIQAKKDVFATTLMMDATPASTAVLTTNLNNQLDKPYDDPTTVSLVDPSVISNLHCVFENTDNKCRPAPSNGYASSSHEYSNDAGAWHNAEVDPWQASDTDDYTRLSPFEKSVGIKISEKKVFGIDRAGYTSQVCKTTTERTHYPNVLSLSTAQLPQFQITQRARGEEMPDTVKRWTTMDARTDSLCTPTGAESHAVIMTKGIYYEECVYNANKNSTIRDSINVADPSNKWRALCMSNAVCGPNVADEITADEYTVRETGRSDLNIRMRENFKCYGVQNVGKQTKREVETTQTLVEHPRLYLKFYSKNKDAEYPAEGNAELRETLVGDHFFNKNMCGHGHGRFVVTHGANTLGCSSSLGKRLEPIESLAECQRAVDYIRATHSQKGDENISYVEDTSFIYPPDLSDGFSGPFNELFSKEQILQHLGDIVANIDPKVVNLKPGFVSFLKTNVASRSFVALRQHEPDEMKEIEEFLKEETYESNEDLLERFITIHRDRAKDDKNYVFPLRQGCKILNRDDDGQQYFAVWVPSTRVVDPACAEHTVGYDKDPRHNPYKVTSVLKALVRDTLSPSRNARILNHLISGFYSICKQKTIDNDHFTNDPPADRVCQTWVGKTERADNIVEDTNSSEDHTVIGLVNAKHSGPGEKNQATGTAVSSRLESLYPGLKMSFSNLAFMTFVNHYETIQFYSGFTPAHKRKWSAAVANSPLSSDYACTCGNQRPVWRCLPYELGNAESLAWDNVMLRNELSLLGQTPRRRDNPYEIHRCGFGWEIPLDADRDVGLYITSEKKEFRVVQLDVFHTSSHSSATHAQDATRIVSSNGYTEDFLDSLLFRGVNESMPEKKLVAHHRFGSTCVRWPYGQAHMNAMTTAGAKKWYPDVMSPDDARIGYCDKFNGKFTYCRDDHWSYEERDAFCTNHPMAGYIFSGIALKRERTMDQVCSPTRHLCLLVPGYADDVSDLHALLEYAGESSVIVVAPFDAVLARQLWATQYYKKVGSMFTGEGELPSTSITAPWNTSLDSPLGIQGQFDVVKLLSRIPANATLEHVQEILTKFMDDVAVQSRVRCPGGGLALPGRNGGGEDVFCLKWTHADVSFDKGPYTFKYNDVTVVSGLLNSEGKPTTVNFAGGGSDGKCVRIMVEAARVSLPAAEFTQTECVIGDDHELTPVQITGANSRQFTATFTVQFPDQTTEVAALLVSGNHIFSGRGAEVIDVQGMNVSVITNAPPLCMAVHDATGTVAISCRSMSMGFGRPKQFVVMNKEDTSFQFETATQEGTLEPGTASIKAGYVILDGSGLLEDLSSDVKETIWLRYPDFTQIYFYVGVVFSILAVALFCLNVALLIYYDATLSFIARMAIYTSVYERPKTTNSFTIGTDPDTNVLTIAFTAGVFANQKSDAWLVAAKVIFSDTDCYATYPSLIAHIQSCVK